MEKLQLSLKAKWFEMTKAGVKKEDYRSITPYWIKRFYDIGKCKSGDIEYFMEWLKRTMFLDVSESQIFKELGISKKHFNINRMTLGYSSATDKCRILELEHKEIEIREGNPDWGAEPGVLYFCILHGDIIQN